MLDSALSAILFELTELLKPLAPLVERKKALAIVLWRIDFVNWITSSWNGSKLLKYYFTWLHFYDMYSLNLFPMPFLSPSTLSTEAVSSSFSNFINFSFKLPSSKFSRRNAKNKFKSTF